MDDLAPMVQDMMLLRRRHLLHQMAAQSRPGGGGSLSKREGFEGEGLEGEGSYRNETFPLCTPSCDSVPPATATPPPGCTAAAPVDPAFNDRVNTGGNMCDACARRGRRPCRPQRPSNTASFTARFFLRFPVALDSFSAAVSCRRLRCSASFEPVGRLARVKGLREMGRGESTKIV